PEHKRSACDAELQAAQLGGHEQHHQERCALEPEQQQSAPDSDSGQQGDPAPDREDPCETERRKPAEPAPESAEPAPERDQQQAARQQGNQREVRPQGPAVQRQAGDAVLLADWQQILLALLEDVLHAVVVVELLPLLVSVLLLVLVAVLSPV